MKSPLRVLIFLALWPPAFAGTATTAGPASKDDVPGWLKEELPDGVQPYVGKRGLPEPWSKRPGPLGSSVAGIDRWQANHFIVHRPETARFLEEAYTPLKVAYRPGTLPAYEKAVARHARGLTANGEKARALLRAMPSLLRHPSIPPCGPHARPDRSLDDEALLQSGAGWCNEQARVFVRLCQAAGVPARMVFLFYADKRSGHVVAEFHADGRWALADTSWLCVFPGKDGRLLSAAEAHAEEGRRHAEAAYRARYDELLTLSDEELTSGPRSAAKVRQALRARKTAPDRLYTFGVLNYPLPR